MIAHQRFAGSGRPQCKVKHTPQTSRTLGLKPWGFLFLDAENSVINYGNEYRVLHLKHRTKGRPVGWSTSSSVKNYSVLKHSIGTAKHIAWYCIAGVIRMF
jgi:hypothetical protein